MIPTPEVSSTHGEPCEAGKESEDDQESDAPEEPQRHAQAPSPNEPAVGARPATFLILQFPQLGRRSWHRLNPLVPIMRAQTVRVKAPENVITRGHRTSLSGHGPRRANPPSLYPQPACGTVDQHDCESVHHLRARTRGTAQEGPRHAYQSQPTARLCALRSSGEQRSAEAEHLLPLWPITSDAGTPSDAQRTLS